MSGTGAGTWAEATWGILAAAEAPEPAPPVGLDEPEAPPRPETPPPARPAGWSLEAPLPADADPLEALLARCQAARTAGVSEAAVRTGLWTLLQRAAAGDAQRAGCAADPFRARSRAAIARLTRRVARGRTSAAEERAPRVAAAVRQAVAAWQPGREHPAAVNAALIEGGLPEELVATAHLAALEAAAPAPGPWYPLLRVALATDPGGAFAALSPLVRSLLGRVWGEACRQLDLSSRPRAIAATAAALGPLADPLLLTSLHLAHLEVEAASSPLLLTEDEDGVPCAATGSAPLPASGGAPATTPAPVAVALVAGAPVAPAPGVESEPAAAPELPPLPEPEPDPTAPRRRSARGRRRTSRMRGRVRGGGGSGSALVIAGAIGLLVLAALVLLLRSV